MKTILVIQKRIDVRARSWSDLHLWAMHAFLSALERSFSSHADPVNAAAMKAYMKDHFPFFGIKAAERRARMKSVMQEYGKFSTEELLVNARNAFARPEREMHQVAVDLLMRQAKKFGPEHLVDLEEFITNKSWWDTVDAIAVNVIGVVLKRYPKEIASWNTRWMESDDMWLNRTALIFQLKWKKDTDTELLFANIDRLAAHKEFFIRKAIGWALREYSKTGPGAVEQFVRSRKLSPLSEREALRKL